MWLDDVGDCTRHGKWTDGRRVCATDDRETAAFNQGYGITLSDRTGMEACKC